MHLRLEGGVIANTLREANVFFPLPVGVPVLCARKEEGGRAKNAEDPRTRSGRNVALPWHLLDGKGVGSLHSNAGRSHRDRWFVRL